MSARTENSGAGESLLMTQPEADRFWSKVGPPDANGCRQWLTGRTPRGYGMFWLRGMQRLAHRVAYAAAHGHLPPVGMVIDHLCRNRACAAIEHLEPVTPSENVQRGDLPALGRAIRANWKVCIHGHDVTDPANVYVYKSGQQACRTCKRDRGRERMRKGPRCSKEPLILPPPGSRKTRATMRTYTHHVDGDEVFIYFPEHEDDLTGFEKFLNMAPRVIGLDSETTGLKIFGRNFRVRLVQFGDAREAWVLRADRFADAIRRTLGRPDLRFVAHNLTFDALVLDRVGLCPLEVLGPKAFDTYLLAHLCDPREKGAGGTGLKLKELSTVYVDSDAADTQDGLNAVFLDLYRAWKKTVSIDEIEAWESQNPKRPHIPWGFTNIPIDHPLYITYAGLDVVYTSRLLKELGALVRQSGLSDLAHFEHRVQLITAYQQRRGLRIDVDYTNRLVADLDAEAIRFRSRAASYGVENVNSTKQVTEALIGTGETLTERTPSGALAVGKEVLLPLADLDARSWDRLGNREPNPLADAIVRSKRAEKWKVAYALPFLNDRDENDHIHPQIKSLAARTARMSVSGPPLQQLPSSDWTIRRAVIADPGEVIAAADFKSMELRVLAALAGVTEMKRAISEGRDLHDYTAALIYGDGFTKNERRYAKGVGLGKVFGGGAAGLAKQIGAPLDQVRHAVQRYDAVYPEVAAWATQLQREAARNGGAVITPSGRRLPMDRDRTYAAVNYKVQSYSRDLLAQALCRIDDAGMGKYVLLPVHDELLVQAPEREAVDVIAEIKRLMETVIDGVPIDADIEDIGRGPGVYGRSWGSGYGCPPEMDAV